MACNSNRYEFFLERGERKKYVISCSSYELAVAVHVYSFPPQASTTCSEDCRGLYTARDASPESSQAYYARVGKYAWTEEEEYGSLDHTPLLVHAGLQSGQLQAQEI
jgi:hypothetical protein